MMELYLHSSRILHDVQLSYGQGHLYFFFTNDAVGRTVSKYRTRASNDMISRIITDHVDERGTAWDLCS
jgi:hypothetical protein